jgi:hypothetical protein
MGLRVCPTQLAFLSGAYRTFLVHVRGAVAENTLQRLDVHRFDEVKVETGSGSAFVIFVATVTR